MVAPHTIVLNPARYEAAVKRSKELGMSPEQYINMLIDVGLELEAERTLDEVLKPIRDGFKHLSDDELDALLDEAKKRTRRAADDEERGK